MRTCFQTARTRFPDISNAQSSACKSTQHFFSFLFFCFFFVSTESSRDNGWQLTVQTERVERRLLHVVNWFSFNCWTLIQIPLPTRVSHSSTLISAPRTHAHACALGHIYSLVSSIWHYNNCCKQESTSSFKCNGRMWKLLIPIRVYMLLNDWTHKNMSGHLLSDVREVKLKFYLTRLDFSESWIIGFLKLFSKFQDTDFWNKNNFFPRTCKTNSCSVARAGVHMRF